MAITSPGFTPQAAQHYTLAETQAEKDYALQRELAKIQAQNAGGLAEASIRESGAAQRASDQNSLESERLGLAAGQQNIENNRQLGLDQQQAFENKRQLGLDQQNAEKFGLDKQTAQIKLDSDKKGQQREDQLNMLNDVALHLSNSQPDENGVIDATPMSKQISAITGTDTSGYKGIVAKNNNQGYTQLFGDTGSSIEPLATASGSPVGFSSTWLNHQALLAGGGKADKSNYEKLKVPVNDSSGNYMADREILADPVSGKIFDPANQKDNTAPSPSEEALKYLHNNRETADAFQKKYGFLPPGFEKGSTGSVNKESVVGRLGSALENVKKIPAGLGGSIIKSDPVPKQLNMSQSEWDALPESVKKAHINKFRRQGINDNVQNAAIGLGHGLAEMHNAGAVLHQ